MQVIDYRPEQVVLLEIAPGYQLTVALASDEQIKSIAIGDSAGWQVTPSHSGDHLFVKPLSGAGTTNMTVVTSGRLYAFDLVATMRSGNAPYTVAFHYGSARAAEVASTGRTTLGHYRVRGDRALRPSSIRDDGQHTYIVWPAEALLPAVYSIDQQGQEALANGAMRDGVYVVDSVNPRLIFRIDQHEARADRAPEGRH